MFTGEGLHVVISRERLCIAPCKLQNVTQLGKKLSQLGRLRAGPPGSLEGAAEMGGGLSVGIETGGLLPGEKVILEGAVVLGGEEVMRQQWRELLDAPGMQLLKQTRRRDGAGPAAPSLGWNRKPPPV